LVDNHTLLAALEQLSDVARESGHAEKKKYDAIFRQCKPLVKDPRLASVVTRLLGDPEEKQVATQIQKLLKSETAQASPSGFATYSPYEPPASRYLRPLLEPPRAVCTKEQLPAQPLLQLWQSGAFRPKLPRTFLLEFCCFSFFVFFITVLLMLDNKGYLDFP
jgi:hypothetical protein